MMCGALIENCSVGVTFASSDHESETAILQAGNP